MSEERVLRVRGDIRASYRRLSRFYGLLEDRFERRLRQRGLALLDVARGEDVLEVGFGTGCSLVDLARRVGDDGGVYGVDITLEMIAVASRRLEKAGLAGRARLLQADARNLPWKDSRFDAVYMAATLELFDTPDIPVVLREAARVLTPGGRLGLLSMPREGHEDSTVLRLYEWAHRTFPRYASCRPIYVEDSVLAAGYKIVIAEEMRLGRLFPMKIIVARPEQRSA